MKDKILPYSLIWLFVILNAQNAFDSKGSFILVVLGFKIVFLTFIFAYSVTAIRSQLKHLSLQIEFKLLTAYIFFIVIAYVRAIELDVLSLSVIVSDIIFIVFIFMYALKVNLSDLKIVYLFYGMFVYLLANLLLLCIGIENPAVATTLTEEASLLKYFGLEIDRLLFPLSPGAGRVGIGVIAGAVLTYTIALLSISNKKPLLLISSLVPLLIILLADTRTSLLSCLLSLSLFYLTRQLNFRSIRFLPFALPLFPMLIMYLSYLAFQSGLAADISREGTGDIASGRSIIWFFAFDELLDYKLIHLIGYGSYGQAISGVSYDYMKMFTLWPNENLELISLHNAAIQMVFDFGYVGLILFMYLMYRLLTIAIDSEDYKMNILAPVLIFIIFSGMTEATPLLYNADMFIAFVFISMHLSLSNIQPK